MRNDSIRPATFVPATIRDVARESGVSVTTASVVLSNSGRPVNPTTRQRVLETAQRLNYQPNVIARGLVRGHSTILGVQFGWVEPAVITNPYAGGVLQGIIETATEAGYRILLHAEAWKNADESLGPYRDGVAAGFVAVAPLADSDAIPALARLGVPLVCVSFQAEEYGIPSVDVDNFAGTRMATEHLIGLGHRRIAHLMGNYNLASVPARRDGFLEALRAAGIPNRPEYLAPGFYDPRTGYAVSRQLLTLPDRPTALVAGNDIIALAALEAAHDLGLIVPDDLSVVGFDDIALASVVRPALTTIRQPLTAIGSAATRLLLARLRGEAVPITTQLLPPELVVRNSTASPQYK